MIDKTYKNSYNGMAFDTCPFCGAPAELFIDDRGFAGIGCSNGRCLVHPHVLNCPSPESAIKDWNIRGKEEFLKFDKQYAPKGWHYPYN